MRERRSREARGWIECKRVALVSFPFLFNELFASSNSIFGSREKLKKIRRSGGDTPLPTSSHP
jgi:hypothetical protein